MDIEACDEPDEIKKLLEEHNYQGWFDGFANMPDYYSSLILTPLLLVYLIVVA